MKLISISGLANKHLTISVNPFSTAIINALLWIKSNSEISLIKTKLWNLIKKKYLKFYENSNNKLHE